MRDPYYDLPQVSNSDLGWLKNQLYPRDMPDPTQAYKFGTLIDAMITEPSKVNYYKRLVDGEQYTVEDFALAAEMKKAFYRDEFCRTISEKADGQKVMIEPMNLNFKGLDFTLQTRCKWDLWREDWGWGGDIKSTACTSQAQFEEACRFFDYHRQRAFYMTISGAQRDVLIGISKKNLKVFKLNITRDTSFFKDGYNQVLELGFKHFTMFGEYKKGA